MQVQPYFLFDRLKCSMDGNGSRKENEEKTFSTKKTFAILPP